MADSFFAHIPPSAAYVVGNLSTGQVKTGSKLDTPALMASTSKFMAAYTYYRLYPEKFANGAVDPVMRRYLSESHADSGVALFAAHFANEGKFTAKELAILQSDNSANMNIRLIKKDADGKYVALPDIASSSTGHLRERQEELGKKIDRLSMDLLNKYAREIGLNVASTPGDDSRSYFTNVNGERWFGEPASRILPRDALKLMTTLYKIDDGQFLKNHSSPNGGWSHTFTWNNKNAERGSHLAHIVPNPAERKSVFCAKTGSFPAGPFARMMCVNDRQGSPHMLFVTGDSTPEVNTSAADLFASIRGPAPAMSPAPTQKKTTLQQPVPQR
jgi:hypothetical protein